MNYRAFSTMVVCMFGAVAGNAYQNGIPFGQLVFSAFIGAITGLLTNKVLR